MKKKHWKYKGKLKKIFKCCFLECTYKQGLCFNCKDFKEFKILHFRYYGYFRKFALGFKKFPISMLY